MASSSKRAGQKVYNPKPLSQAPPETNPFENAVQFVSDEVFDRTPIPSDDPKRPVELPYDWIMEERLRRGGKQMGRTYMIFIDPETGEHFRSLEEVRRHLGLETKRSKSKTSSSPKNIPMDAPKEREGKIIDDNRECELEQKFKFDKHEEKLGEEFEKEMQRAIRKSQMIYMYGPNNRRNDGASSSSSLRPDKAPIDEPYNDED